VDSFAVWGGELHNAFRQSRESEAGFARESALVGRFKDYALWLAVDHEDCEGLETRRWNRLFAGVAYEQLDGVLLGDKLDMISPCVGDAASVRSHGIMGERGMSEGDDTRDYWCFEVHEDSLLLKG
jgi:hypothetical protein